MPPVRIVDPKDSRIAEYFAVSEPERARRRGVFVAEGRFVVQRLIEDGRNRVRSLLLNDAAHRALEPILCALPAETPVYLAAATEMRAITGFDIHRGCLAVAERPPEIPVERLSQSGGILVILEGVANADNVGGVFRNAAAFGVHAVLLTPTCGDPLYRKAIRTSMGAVLRVPFARIGQWPAELARIRRNGYSVVALTPRESSVTIDEFASLERPVRVALLIGAEGPGLSEAALSLAAHRVRIPTTNAVDSLNIAVATGIVLSRLSQTGTL